MKGSFEYGQIQAVKSFLGREMKVSYETSMHSSRMRTARLLTVSCSITYMYLKGGERVCIGDLHPGASTSRRSASRGVGHTPRVCLRDGGQVEQTPSPCEQNNR